MLTAEGAKALEGDEYEAIKKSAARSYKNTTPAPEPADGDGWLDELPLKLRGQTDQEVESGLALLASRPGKWRLLKSYEKRSSAQSIWDRLKKRGMHGIEVAVRTVDGKCNVYGRFVGKED